METIEIRGGSEEPPAWAALERELLATTNDAVEPFLDRYLDEDGAALWPPGEDYEGIGGLDNVYEGFADWPLFYLLGGGEHVHRAARDAWEAITAQFAEIPTGLGHPQVVEEYQQGYDWFHQSEGNLLFYHLCMADPADEAFRERARRFAGLYLNEGDADLYDEEHRLLRAPHLGSEGPAWRNFSADLPEPAYHAHAESRIPWEYAAWKERYGLPFRDVEGVEDVADLRDPEKARRMGEAIRERCARGDVAGNLAATTLVTNAYLLTGERRYREWVREYVEAWAERTEENDGILPDNVGLSGEVGEYLDGRWYGGWYGWTWPHGWHSLGAAVTTAAENATLLTGDTSHLDLPRSQLEHLMAKGIERDGTLYLPHRRGDPGTHAYERDGVLKDDDGTVFQREGWFEFAPTGTHDVPYPTHLWYLSMRDDDRERLARLRDDRRDPRAIEPTDRKDGGGHEYAWLAYLDGEFPEYPERILRHDLGRVHERVAFAREEDQDPSTYSEVYLQHRSPVATEALVQLTTGGPQMIYNGGLALGRVRHFDPGRERPGLPPGVGALVTAVESDRTVLELHNLGATRRELIVQAGTLAEHRFETVTYDDRTYAFEERPYGYDVRTTDESRAIEADGDALRVRLAGGAHATLELETELLAGDPTYAFPWDR